MFPSEDRRRCNNDSNGTSEAENTRSTAWNERKGFSVTVPPGIWPSWESFPCSGNIGCPNFCSVPQLAPHPRLSAHTGREETTSIPYGYRYGTCNASRCSTRRHDPCLPERCRCMRDRPKLSVRDPKTVLRPRTRVASKCRQRLFGEGNSTVHTTFHSGRRNESYNTFSWHVN